MTVSEARMRGQIKMATRATNAVAMATKEFSSLSHSQSIPVGLCQCGCGGKTNPARLTDEKRNMVKGRPVRYIHNHHHRKSGVDFIAEDRGHDTPCWIWQLVTTPKGYGMVRQDGRMQRAHRAYYEKHIGPIPDGLQLDHLCRVRNCVNPDHLEPVTNAENTRRGARAKLDPEKAREIRASSASSAELALRFGVCKTVIVQVRNGRIWKAVTRD